MIRLLRVGHPRVIDEILCHLLSEFEDRLLWMGAKVLVCVLRISTRHSQEEAKNTVSPINRVPSFFQSDGLHPLLVVVISSMSSIEVVVDHFLILEGNFSLFCSSKT